MPSKGCPTSFTSHNQRHLFTCVEQQAPMQTLSRERP
ncbi:hypothetical protein C8C95_3587 [Acidovorax sp. 99]|nr:hypothetical protein C8C95_3587 [Acidovorax sp. 99]